MMRSRNQSAEDLLGTVETTHHRVAIPRIRRRSVDRRRRVGSIVRCRKASFGCPIEAEQNWGYSLHQGHPIASDPVQNPIMKGENLPELMKGENVLGRTKMAEDLDVRNFNR